MDPLVQPTDAELEAITEIARLLIEHVDDALQASTFDTPSSHRSF
jgi:hypothetical protein